MDNYKFMPLTDIDLAEASKLYENSIKDNPKGFIQDIDFHGSLNKMNTDFTKDNGGVFLLRNDLEIIGIGALRNDQNNEVEICKLHVKPKYKGKGLGRRLADELMQEARKRNYKKMNLHVTKTQTAAIGLYGKLGFTKYHEQVYTVNTNGKDEYFDTVLMNRML
tara:strand:- start:1523 stop:2014 length:492 start_codon:yes stop_codon:yes gene_type:complete